MKNFKRNLCLVTVGVMLSSTSVYAEVVQPVVVSATSSVTLAAEANGEAELKTGIEYEYGDNKNYAEAMVWYKKSAELGNTLANVYVGDLYANGKGVSVDKSEANKWYEKAMEMGDAYGYERMGFSYLVGSGLGRDYTKAMEYFDKAISMGNAEAISNKGCMYLYAYGVKKDIDKATELFKQAIEKGDARSLLYMGVVEADNNKNYASAMTYYKKVLDLDNFSGQTARSAALNHIGFLYKNGCGVEISYETAMEWYLKSADLGCAKAMYNAGEMCLIGYDGTAWTNSYDRRIEKAIVWFEKAADVGNTDGLVDIGDMYYSGYGHYVPEWSKTKDYTKAMEWYKKAADLGDTKAIVKIGDMYYKGNTNVKQNFTTAIEWYEKAIALGDTSVGIKVGSMYYFGSDFVKKDYAKAFEWYKKVADLGDTDAMQVVAYCYQQGIGVEKNQTLANEWCKKIEAAFEEVCGGDITVNADGTGSWVQN